MRYVFIILFIITSSCMFAQPNYNNPTKWIAKYNPQTKQPDYSVRIDYIQSLIDSVETELEILNNGYAILPFEYDGTVSKTISVDTSVLFPALRSTINIPRDSLFFQFTNVTSISGWYEMGDTVYIDTSGTGGAAFLDPYKVFLNGAFNSFGHYRDKNQIIFLSPLKIYTEVSLIGEFAIEEFHKTFVSEAGQTVFNLSEIDYHIFTTTSGQTVFDCSSYFDLNDEYKVFINGGYQSYGHTRTGNIVTFDTGFNEDVEVTIMSGRVYGDQYYHVFEATSGQTNFNCSPYFTLTDNYKVWVNGAFQSYNHSRSGNTVIFTDGFDENTEVMISL